MRTGAAPESAASALPLGLAKAPCLQHQPGLVWSNSEPLDLGYSSTAWTRSFSLRLLFPGDTIAAWSLWAFGS